MSEKPIDFDKINCDCLLALIFAEEDGRFTCTKEDWEKVKELEQ